ncbi:GAF domain-containing sensor histidine kinase [Dyadobacter sandarakinus]|uniref:histidine kinase n=1 Tax=Dyadobacter sandarakinus TaxID=2747268 RepID=A0ABX7I3E2_9BACT|nr:GAF domain-containing sensor histidine kinase [Dyadobacter sandarakinus]QRR00413.1 GAF domain-containing sensor histidine kinase [Dyadobacter sandarakinus]
MKKTATPIPADEKERLIRLADLDIDYSQHHEGLQHLARLAAAVTGTSMSMINLIDSLTQWTISNYGLDIQQLMREDSVCQYTIMAEDSLEVGDLSQDERFQNKDFVVQAPLVRYYYGIPLRTSAGTAVGALCVMDQKSRHLEPEKVEMLKIIADEVVTRLKTLRMVESLKNRLVESRQSQKKVAHDIRGPLGGIIGLAKIISDLGEANEIGEVIEFMHLIQNSGKSVLDMAEEILGRSEDTNVPGLNGKKERTVFNLAVLREKVVTLYGPQARQKQIDMSVSTSGLTENIPFTGSKLLQIAGNLISNAIKFTPTDGHLEVDLNLIIDPSKPVLKITVLDTGLGMAPETIEAILSGGATSSNGTEGEQGYGFGLALVKHLVESLNGHIDVFSRPGRGTRFEVVIPQNIYGT